MKNLLLRILLFLLAPLKPRSRDPSTCLVISTTALGDTVFASGVLYSMKLKKPRLSIDFLTTPAGAAVLENHKALRTIFTLKDKTLWRFIPLFFRLRKNRYETVYIFHASQRMAVPLAKFLNPTHIIASEGHGKGLDDLIDHRLTAQCHEVERRYLIAEKRLGRLERLPLSLHTSKWTDAHTQNKLRELFDISGDYILVQPFAKNKFKIWPHEFFEELIHRLMEFTSLPILILGSPKEASLARSFTKSGVHAAAGIFNMIETSSLIKRARLLISNDTGPMHIGFAHQTPTVALFSPTTPKWCGPYLSKNYEILAKPRTCTPCLRKKCQDPFCMRQISVEEVFGASKRLLEETSNVQG